MDKSVYLHFKFQEPTYVDFLFAHRWRLKKNKGIRCVKAPDKNS
jgi:hypothetical protein